MSNRNWNWVSYPGSTAAPTIVANLITFGCDRISTKTRWIEHCKRWAFLNVSGALMDIGRPPPEPWYAWVWFLDAAIAINEINKL